jgi:hypothetical protein
MIKMLLLKAKRSAPYFFEQSIKWMWPVYARLSSLNPPSARPSLAPSKSTFNSTSFFSIKFYMK